MKNTIAMWTFIGVFLLMGLMWLSFGYVWVFAIDAVLFLLCVARAVYLIKIWENKIKESNEQYENN